MKPGIFIKPLFSSMLLTTAFLFLGGCPAPPDLTGFPVNTPDYYHENKVFFLEKLSPQNQYKQRSRLFKHVHEVNAQSSRPNDIIKHGDPISVVLQGVRIPEDLQGGTRDIAVVLDVHTSSKRGLTTLLAFYQRDVRPGQLLNFSNLLVYADPAWDSANPPYFRVRVLDVKAERNRRTAAVMEKVSNLSGEISGMVPHPAIPIVTTAIDAAGLIMSNQENQALLDYQIQFYGTNHTTNAGDATLGPLLAGQWLAVGRARHQSSQFWESEMMLDRKTDRVLMKIPTSDGKNTVSTNVLVPYVSMVIIKADAEVPGLVLDRSEELLTLLSTKSSKSDVDLLEMVMSNLKSAVNGYTVERRLRKYKSGQDLRGIIRQLEAHEGGSAKINTHEMRRLIYILKAVTAEDVRFETHESWIEWWGTNGSGHFEDDPSRPFGIIWKSP